MDDRSGNVAFPFDVGLREVDSEAGFPCGGEKNTDNGRAVGKGSS